MAAASAARRATREMHDPQPIRLAIRPGGMAALAAVLAVETVGTARLLRLALTPATLDHPGVVVAAEAVVTARIARVQETTPAAAAVAAAGVEALARPLETLATLETLGLMPTTLVCLLQQEAVTPLP